MADMTVDTAALRQRAASVNELGEEQKRAGSLSQTTVESDISAFGEINAALHGPWREVKERQERAWSELGDRSQEHAEKLGLSASGYDGTEAAGQASLQTPNEL